MPSPELKLRWNVSHLITKSYIGAKDTAPCLNTLEVNGVSFFEDGDWHDMAFGLSRSRNCDVCGMPAEDLDEDYCCCIYAPRNVWHVEKTRNGKMTFCERKLLRSGKPWARQMKKVRKLINYQVKERDSVRKARERWCKIQELVTVRGIAMAWMGQTQASLCAKGGTGRAEDKLAFTADCVA